MIHASHLDRWLMLVSNMNMMNPLPMFMEKQVEVGWINTHWWWRSELCKHRTGQYDSSPEIYSWTHSLFTLNTLFIPTSPENTHSPDFRQILRQSCQPHEVPKVQLGISRCQRNQRAVSFQVPSSHELCCPAWCGHVDRSKWDQSELRCAGGVKYVPWAGAVA